MLLFQSLSVSRRSQAIAQDAFRENRYEMHADPDAYKIVYDKPDPWGHYYDFVLDPRPPGTDPGEMGSYRVHVSWLATTTVGGFLGMPQ